MFSYASHLSLSVTSFKKGHQQELVSKRDLRFIFIIYNSFFQVCVDECILVLHQVLQFTFLENKRGLYWSQNINRKGEVVL